MPLRARSDLYWNWPGVVAAYQPVMCPGGSLLARYNMAHGGDNCFMATPGTAPMWSPVSGWEFDGASQYLSTGYVAGANQDRSLFIRFSGVSAVDYMYLAGAYSSTTGATGRYRFGISIDWGTTGVRFNNHSDTDGGPTIASGVLGFAGLYGYRNGMVDSGAIGADSGDVTHALYIGALNYVGTAANFITGNVQNLVTYNRVLSAAEVWTASRQMAYCDVNPEWSVWSRRRQWYYGSTAGFLAAWAQRNNRLLGGGVN